MMPLTATQTPVGFANASDSITGGFASSTGLLPPLATLLVLVAAGMVVLYAASAVERYERLYQKLQYLGEILRYAVIGVITTATIAGGGYAVYRGAQAAGEAPPIVWKGLILVIISMPILAVIGRGTERLVLRIGKHHQEVTPTPEDANDG